MNVSTKNEVIKQLDAVTTHTYSEFKPDLSKNVKKQARTPRPLKNILNGTFELTFTILIVASILGIYFASGLHDWWVQLVGQIN